MRRNLLTTRTYHRERDSKQTGRDITTKLDSNVLETISAPNKTRETLTFLEHQERRESTQSDQEKAGEKCA